MFIGIDLGTSSIKTILIDENQKTIGFATHSIELSNPASGFFEQNPDSWFTATLKCFDKLKNEFPKEYRATQSIGISGEVLYSNWKAGLINHYNDQIQEINDLKNSEKMLFINKN